MTTEYPILCKACARWHGPGPAGAYCDSFPDGIPEDILPYGADHREPRGRELPFELDPARRDLYQDWLDYSPNA